MNYDMKTILIKFDNSFFVRNFLRTDVFTILTQTPDIKIIFLVHAEKISYYRKEFGSERVVFDVLPESKHFLTERFFKFVETASIHSHTVSMIHKTEFVRTASQKSFFSRIVLYGTRRTLWWLGQFSCWRKLIRSIYGLLPSSTFSIFFHTYAPDIIFCPSVAYTDARMLKEARARGIKTLGMILSWDNLHSKTLVRTFPDMLIVHTDSVKKQAHQFADYPLERIVVSGIPQYDRYITRSDSMPRDQFIKEIGGDPQKKLLVYAVSGKAGLHIDYDMVKLLQGAIENKEINSNVQLMLRAHPRYDFTPEKLKRIQEEYGCLVTPAMAHVGESRDSWEFDERTVSFLSNTLAHADIIIAMYTTFFIEAAIFDKPLIAIGFDVRTLDYMNSARHFFEWDHLRELDELKGIWRVQSRDELIHAINTYLNNPGYLREGRKKIVTQQSQFTDGKSGERLAHIILNALRK